MSDFTKMNGQQLKNVLTFTTKLADQMEQEAVNFSELQTNESLAEVVKSTRNYVKRRNANLSPNSTFADADEQAEIDEIRSNIKDYYKRTRKVVKG